MSVEWYRVVAYMYNGDDISLDEFNDTNSAIAYARNVVSCHSEYASVDVIEIGYDTSLGMKYVGNCVFSI